MVRTTVRGGLAATIGILCASAALAVAQPDRSVEHQASPAASLLELPRPTGRLPVGTYLGAVSDSHRREVFTDDPEDKRRVAVKIFYPAARQCRPQPYLPAPVSEFYRSGLAADEGFEQRLIGHACSGARPSRGSNKFPLILFSHGLGFTHSFYTSLLEDLASHGNIVVAIDHTHGMPATYFPDGSVVRRDNNRWSGDRAPLAAAEYYRDWAQDARGILDRIFRKKSTILSQGLAGRVDLDRVAYIGHSFGGLAAIYAAQTDSRIKGAVNMDGMVGGGSSPDGTRRPSRMLLPVAAEVPILVLNQARTHEREFYSDRTRVAQIHGATHMTFSDILWLGERFGRVQAGDGTKGTPLPAEEGIRLTRDILSRFLECAFTDSCGRLDESLALASVPPAER